MQWSTPVQQMACPIPARMRGIAPSVSLPLYRQQLPTRYALLSSKERESEAEVFREGNRG